MKSKKDRDGSLNQPFANLQVLLKKKKKDKKAFAPKPPQAPVFPKPLVSSTPKTAPDQGDGDQLFEKWMADVEPLAGRPAGTAVKPKSAPLVADPDEAVFDALQDLVDTGRGFVVSQTDEYVEGTGYGAPKGLARRLHKGDFSIQAHQDLHGLTEDQAYEVFDEFIRESIEAGKRAVLVIHGRGLCSPGDPVLKKAVIQWLTKGPWRKWVMAFASARACDGGAGCTYVLLRRRPVTKSGKRG